MTEDDPIYNNLPSRCHRVTIVGAIGETLTRPVFMCAKSTNAKEFRRFLDMLKVAVRPHLAGTGRPKPIVLLDNASAHKTLLSKRFLEKKFQPLFQPPHS